MLDAHLAIHPLIAYSVKLAVMSLLQEVVAIAPTTVVNAIQQFASAVMWDTMPILQAFASNAVKIVHNAHR